MVLRIFKGLWYIYLKVYIYFMLKIKNNFLFRSMNMRKMYKNLSPESVPAMPMVPSAQTFNLDIPENKSTMTTWNRTFIPMQLRTQPSNLPPSQLQRMNTTLGEQAKGTHSLITAFWETCCKALVAWLKRMHGFFFIN